MANLTVKNIPDELYARLKASAGAHRRSTNSELIYCLEKVLLPGRISPEEHLAAARALRGRIKGEGFLVEDIDRLKRAGRPHCL